MYIFLPEILILIEASEELIPYYLTFGRTIFLFLPCMLTITAFQSLWMAAEKPFIGFRRSILQGLTVKFQFEPKKLLRICYNGMSEMADAISANVVELFIYLYFFALNKFE